MHDFLRRLARWRGERKGAQVIIFDGGADVDKTRSFLKGTFVGAGLAIAAFAVTAPTMMDPQLADEISHREELLHESNARAERAMEVADVCLSTARNLESTLAAYQAFLGSGNSDRSNALLGELTD